MSVVALQHCHTSVLLLVSLYHPLQWLQDEFLPYLDQWGKSVEDRPGFTPAQKKRMLISHETLLGLRMTSKHTYIMCMYMFVM